MIVKYCNCCECGKELVGLSTPADELQVLRERGESIVAGKINDRPYCFFCLRTSRIPGLSKENGLTPRQEAKLTSTSG